MEIIDRLKDAITVLDEIDTYSDNLTNQQSEIDSKLSDLYHYIEKNNLNAPQACKMIKEIQKQRKIRRKIKEDIELSKVYKNNINRLNTVDNRKFVLAEIHKANNKLNTTYRNRVYTEEELKELLGGIKCNQ